MYLFIIFREKINLLGFALIRDHLNCTEIMFFVFYLNDSFNWFFLNAVKLSCYCHIFLTLKYSKIDKNDTTETKKHKLKQIIC